MKMLMKVLGQAVFIASLLFTANTFSAEKVTYFHHDAQGSIVAATDQQGNVVWRETYQPYGERVRKEPAAANNTRWYTGHPQDSETGLVYMGARYYDPAIGRFMAVDPAPFTEKNIHSFNRYNYANNNPYKYVDPDGRAAETVLDVISLGLSVNEYRQNPSFWNGVGVAVDAVGTAIPFVPAGVGTIRQIGKGVDRAAGEAVGGIADANRTASQAKGIPDSAIGPSGLPKRHTVEHNTRKGARETAERRAPPDGRARHDANPTDPRQGPHYQAEDAKGQNVRPVVHHEYPK